MPVIDHPVHDRVKIDAETFRYGCHSSRRGLTIADGHYSKDGHAAASPDGTKTVQKWTWTPHVMSKDCRSFRLWDEDPACKGCRFPKDYAYANLWGYALPEIDKNDVHGSTPSAAG
jgi:hypothetical protein